MRNQRPIALFADFDDTLTLENAAQFLLKRFAPEGFARFREEYQAGEITFREYQEKSFDCIKAPVDELQRAVADEMELRPGTHELVSAVTEADGRFTVLSAGLDIYIEPVIRRHGLEPVNVISGKAQRNGSDTGPFRYDYPFGNVLETEPCNGDWATCKCKALEQVRGEAVTLFVGDGSTSDACAAQKADHVFARDRLLRICNENGTPATPFEDLGTVAEFVTELATGKIIALQDS